MKREYTVKSMAYADDYLVKLADDWWCHCHSWDRDWWIKMFIPMIFRYEYHPNRMLRVEGTKIREFIHKLESGVEVDSAGYEARWFGRFFPNGCGQELVEKECDRYRKATRRIQFTTPLYYQIASRIHIAATRYKVKYGKNPKTCDDLVEFMEKVPQKLLGKDVEVDLGKGIVRCGDIIEELYHDEKNAYAVFSRLVGTEACPSNCYCDVYRKENLRIDIHSPENQFLTQYWDTDGDDAQSDDCTIGGYHFGYQYPPSWEESDMFTNRVLYARIVDDIIASNEVVAAMIQKASKCSIYDSGTNEVDTSALISIIRGYGCARIHRMIETGLASEAVAALRQLVHIGELVIKGRASIDEKCMGMAIIRNAQEITRLSIPVLGKDELSEMALLFKLDCPMHGVDMHEDIVRGYLRNDMLRIEIAEALRRRFDVEWSNEIKYLHRRIMTAYDEGICTAFQTRCYREGIGVVANAKRADEMEARAVNYTHRKMESYLDANPLVPAKDEDKKKGRKWDLKHSIWRYMYGTDATDAWGRQFKCHWSSKTGYLTIMSSGCDGEWGTDDDLEKTAHADTPNHTQGEDR